LRQDIDRLVNTTRTELDDMVKGVRKDVMKELKRMVQATLGNQQLAAEKVSEVAGEKIQSIQSTSETHVLLYFVGLQVLIALCVYLSLKYAKLAA